MYEGMSCEELSLGFVLGVPTAIAAVCWLMNLAWILRGDQQQPPPTALEMGNLYEELMSVLVKRPPPLPSVATDTGVTNSAPRSATRDDDLEAASETAPRAHTTSKQNAKSSSQRGVLALSPLWSSGLGAVVVLVRRTG